MSGTLSTLIRGVAVAVIVLSAYFVVTSTSVFSLGDSEIVSCGVVDAPGYYYLSSNITNVTGTCIIISSDDVIIDGKGRWISGESGTGIYATGGKSNITVRNLTISGLNNGVVFVNVTGGAIERVNITGCNESGIHLSGDGILVTDSTVSSAERGIVFHANHSRAENNTLSNNTVGFVVAGSWNTVTENRITFNDIGLQIREGSGNTIADNLIANNKMYDVFIPFSSGPSVCDNTVENNTGSGGRIIGFFNTSIRMANLIFSELILCGVSGAYIENVTVAGSDGNNNGILILHSTGVSLDSVNSSHNYLGVSLASSSGVTVSGSTLIGNVIGAAMYASTHNTLTGNEIAENENGVYIHNSTQNILQGNVISSNDIGIHLESEGAAQSEDNTIFDNLLNNTENFLQSGEGQNSWNLSAIPGTNIVGGHFIGGNFWATPEGTGFSQECEDRDGDSICDSPYTLNDDNIDYLPLAPVTPAPAPTSPTVPPSTPNVQNTPTPQPLQTQTPPRTGPTFTHTTPTPTPSQDPTSVPEFPGFSLPVVLLMIALAIGLRER
ncbi:parallel beta-helix repeat {two copies} [Geoglobus ahangari]|uniref:Parallel beta-helix repeat (two copies) n=1 Tax=Geoglobus ahangari TaxID=113653 RepID=A0A0F7DBL0_9EURY|nr:parallel beta-helix repeat {two copies} [Geoglobus ahangari]